MPPRLNPGNPNYNRDPYTGGTFNSYYADRFVNPYETHGLNPAIQLWDNSDIGLRPKEYATDLTTVPELNAALYGDGNAYLNMISRTTQANIGNGSYADVNNPVSVSADLPIDSYLNVVQQNTAQGPVVMDGLSAPMIGGFFTPPQPGMVPSPTEPGRMRLTQDAQAGLQLYGYPQSAFHGLPYESLVPREELEGLIPPGEVGNIGGDLAQNQVRQAYFPELMPGEPIQPPNTQAPPVPQELQAANIAASSSPELASAGSFSSGDTQLASVGSTMTADPESMQAMQQEQLLLQQQEQLLQQQQTQPSQLDGSASSAAYQQSLMSAQSAQQAYQAQMQGSGYRQGNPSDNLRMAMGMPPGSNGGSSYNAVALGSTDSLQEFGMVLNNMVGGLEQQVDALIASVNAEKAAGGAGGGMPNDMMAYVNGGSGNSATSGANQAQIEQIKQQILRNQQILQALEAKAQSGQPLSAAEKQQAQALVQQNNQLLSQLQQAQNGGGGASSAAVGNGQFKYASPSASQSWEQVLNGDVSSGQSFSAHRSRSSGAQIHAGIDWDGTEDLGGGKQANSMFSNGVVVSTKAWGEGATDQDGGESNAIRVKYALPGGGEFYVDYGHLKASQNKVQEGSRVDAGTPVGVTSLSDSWSSGGHLDVKIRVPDQLAAQFQTKSPSGMGGYSFVDVKEFMRWYQQKASGSAVA